MKRKCDALLAAFSRAIHQQYERTRPTQDYWLALSVLHKRAFSSARSLQHSIDRRLATLQTEEATSASQLELPIGDLASELTSADEEPDWPPLLTLEDAAHERDLLGALAEARRGRHSTKRKSPPSPDFSGASRSPRSCSRSIATLWHVQASLGASSVTLHGGLTREERASASTSSRAAAATFCSPRTPPVKGSISNRRADSSSI